MVENKRKKNLLGWAGKRIALIVYDLLAVNLSYYLALMVRFYVHGEFRAIADKAYVPAFVAFAPFYSVLCIAVFMLFRLYDRRWRHAGLHDMNRIALANLATVVIQVIGMSITMAILKDKVGRSRMPYTYYLIGAVLQLVLVTASRFGYRLLLLEKQRLSRRTGINVMIVGVGETAHILRRQMEGNNLANPVCFFSINDSGSGTLDGIPVVGDLDRLKEYAEKYRIRCVVLADSILPAETREMIKEKCRACDLEVQDFSGYLTNDGPELTAQKVLERAGGRVAVVIDGVRTEYENSEQALMALNGKYEVRSLNAADSELVLELTKTSVILNDMSASWIQEAGEDISFF